MSYFSARNSLNLVHIHCTLLAIKTNMPPRRVVVKDRLCGAMYLVCVEDMFQ